jgi:hypothetical protein
MKTKILEALKTKYKTLGFTDKAFEGVAEYLSKSVTKDEEVDATVAGAELLLKAFQGDVDKRVTDALSTAKTQWQAEQSPKPAAEKNKPDKDDDKGAPDWVKTIMETNKTLLEKVSTLERDHVMTGQHSRIKAKLKESNVPEIYYGKMMAGKVFRDDAEIDQFATDIVTGWGEVRQSLADENLGQSHKPLLGDRQKDGVSSAVKDYIDAKTNPKSTGSLGGKQLIPSN